MFKLQETILKKTETILFYIYIFTNYNNKLHNEPKYFKIRIRHLENS
jgi:hypothetical protein